MAQATVGVSHGLFSVHVVTTLCYVMTTLIYVTTTGKHDNATLHNGSREGSLLPSFSQKVVLPSFVADSDPPSIASSRDFSDDVDQDFQAEVSTREDVPEYQPGFGRSSYLLNVTTQSPYSPSRVTTSSFQPPSLLTITSSDRKSHSTAEDVSGIEAREQAPSSLSSHFNLHSTKESQTSPSEKLDGTTTEANTAFPASLLVLLILQGTSLFPTSHKTKATMAHADTTSAASVTLNVSQNCTSESPKSHNRKEKAAISDAVMTSTASLSSPCNLHSTRQYPNSSNTKEKATMVDTDTTNTASLPFFLHSLEPGEPQRRTAAADTTNTASLPFLLHSLELGEPQRRTAAADTTNTASLPSLLHSLEPGEPQRRTAAADTTNTASLPSLLHSLEPDQPQQWMAAADTTSVLSPSDATRQPGTIRSTVAPDFGRYQRNCLLDCRVRHINLSTEEVSDCLAGRTTSLSFTVAFDQLLDLTLHLDSRAGSLPSQRQEPLVCWLNVKLPGGTFPSFLITRQTCTPGVSLVVDGTNMLTKNKSRMSWDGCFTGPPPGDTVPTMNPYFPVGPLGLRVGNFTGQYTAHIQLQAIVRSAHLELHYLSQVQGYIQTFNFDAVHLDLTRYFLPYPTMDGWVRVRIPSGCTAMISVPTVSLGGYHGPQHFQSHFFYRYYEHLLEVRQGAQLDKVWTVDGLKSEFPSPRIVHSSDLFVHFRNTRLEGMDARVKIRRVWKTYNHRPALPSMLRGAGFRLLFSFHTKDQQPQRLASGRWNCSVDHWPEFSDHLRCNLVTECEGGEDEMDCPYTACGDHSIVFKDKCYSLHRSMVGISWHKANARCHNSGGMLATFKDPGSLNYLTDTLRLGWLTRAGYIIIVGVRLQNTDIFNYTLALQYVDDTVAYNVTSYGGDWEIHAVLSYGIMQQNRELPEQSNNNHKQFILDIEGEMYGNIVRVCANHSCYYLCERPHVRADERRTHVMSDNVGTVQVVSEKSGEEQTKHLDDHLQRAQPPSDKRMQATATSDHRLHAVPLAAYLAEATPSTYLGPQATPAANHRLQATLPGVFLDQATPSPVSVVEATPSVLSPSLAVPHVVCPSGHLVHAVLSNDMQSQCFDRNDVITVRTCDVNSTVCGHNQTTPRSFVRVCNGTYPSVVCNESHATFRADSTICDKSFTCIENVTSAPMTFDCANALQHVPFTLVCDHRQDCEDGSDESFCVFPPCNFDTHFECNNKECHPYEVACDNNVNCLDLFDETGCYAASGAGAWYTGSPVKLPPGHVVVRDVFNPQGGEPLPDNSTDCPADLYRCADRGLCLPAFTRCNGVFDCPAKEDEAGCGTYTCPGYYRCRGSPQCVPPSEVCNGKALCPQLDDEWFCHLTCPQGCTCVGLTFECHSSFRISNQTRIRYLNAGGSGTQLRDLRDNTMLIYLSLADCRVSRLHTVFLPNLHTLDLSDNLLPAISVNDLLLLGNLRVLTLARNPLQSVFSAAGQDTHRAVPTLLRLDLHQVPMNEIDLTSLAPFTNLKMLNLSGCGLEVMKEGSNRTLRSLQVLDLEGCLLTSYPRELLRQWSDLEAVRSDDYKLCCPIMLPPGFKPENCRAPFDEISSCDDLLRSDAYVVALAVSATLAVVGNLGSVVIRVLVTRTSSKSAFELFVLNLCVSDLLMGVYLVMIGVADRVYRGQYLWEDSRWRHSAVCAAAGFVSLLSCEVSTFLICLITLDRFLVLRFPFSRVRFHGRSALLACLLAWLTGAALSAVPLLPSQSFWRFYSQSGICIPLPVTRKAFPGQMYAFYVMVLLNFVLFVLIAAGQAMIYLSVHSNQMKGVDSSRSARDKTIARRLITIAVTDFLCWGPIGLLGLLAVRGVPIASEVSVAMAIFVLPLNSALNPFLYTFNLYREKRQKRKEAKLLALLQSRNEHNTDRVTHRPSGAAQN